MEIYTSLMNLFYEFFLLCVHFIDMKPVLKQTREKERETSQFGIIRVKHLKPMLSQN